MTQAEIEKEEMILSLRLIPSVRSLKLVSDKFFRLEDKCKFELDVPCECADEASKLVADNIRAFWNIEARISVTQAESDHDIGPEGYAVRITATKVTISASAIAGVRYATYTLRQLAETERGVQTSTSCFLPCVRIEDAPSCRFRGMHICWFPRPEIEPFEIERAIRLAAYYKLNYIVLESWGVIRYRSHPEFAWSDCSVGSEEIHRLVRLGRKLGVTLIPQLNIFGHASASRNCTAKHVLLDRHPEFSPLSSPTAGAGA